MPEYALSVRDVKIRYRYLKKMSLKSLLKPQKTKKSSYFEAVKGISFELEKGRILGIVGKNGSGKSTLLRAIAGIFSADEGSIDLHGNSVSLLSIGVGFNSKALNLNLFFGVINIHRYPVIKYSFNKRIRNIAVLFNSRITYFFI